MELFDKYMDAVDKTIDMWVEAMDAWISMFQIGDPKEALIKLHTK